MKDGVWKYFYSNGNIKEEGNYKDGLKDGIWKYQNENGCLKSEGSYENGKKEGYYEEDECNEWGGHR